MYINLLLNIIAEIFGIVITVFLIDRLIKRMEKEKEEKRWLPAKQIVHYRLAQSLEAVLKLLDGESWLLFLTRFVYSFGDLDLRSSYDFLEPKKNLLMILQKI